MNRQDLGFPAIPLATKPAIPCSYSRQCTKRNSQRPRISPRFVIFSAVALLANRSGMGGSIVFLNPAALEPGFSSKEGAEIWKEDECRKLLFSASSCSLNGPDLFTEFPLLWSSLPQRSFTECLALIREKALFFTDFCFVASPSPNSVPHVGRTHEIPHCLSNTCKARSLKNN